ncbi:DUF2505 domain-containing protein [Spongiibacter sp.]|uniref:DUF2505 domain-containing protein n=1 Tax=Spongiibacter sp. TaxID=2024860 RepID=UPI00356AAA13
MSVSQQFEQDLETVWTRLLDADFRVERSLALGELSASCEIEDSGDRVTVAMSREVTRELPSVLAKVFNPKQTLKFREEWQADGDGWSGTINITVDGQPVTLSADMSLQPKGEGCEYRVSHRCKARIPLVGGKVEKFVLSQTDEGAIQELDYLKNALG